MINAHVWIVYRLTLIAAIFSQSSAIIMLMVVVVVDDVEMSSLNAISVRLCPVVGWEDETTNCNIRSDDCLNHRCLNGATCADGLRSYTCFCPAGYTGNVVILSLFLAFFGSATTTTRVETAGC